METKVNIEKFVFENVHSSLMPVFTIFVVTQNSKIVPIYIVRKNIRSVEYNSFFQ